MPVTRPGRSALRLLVLGAGLAGVAGAAYGTWVASAWSRYGQPRRPRVSEADSLLDRFMPRYDVVERHHIRVRAPAAITLATAKDMDLLDVPLIRAIFRGRELILRSAPDREPRPHGILELTKSLGWAVLEDVADREIVMGAVTKPWEANVTFHGLPPEEFAAFDEPGWVKIAWTLRADADGLDASTFRTETRVLATDAYARRRFRRYWATLSPGIILIRKLSLRPTKVEAERRARLSTEELRTVNAGGNHDTR